MDEERQKHLVNHVLMPVMTLVGIVVGGLSVSEGVSPAILYLLYFILGLTGFLMLVILTAGIRRSVTQWWHRKSIERVVKNDVDTLWSELPNTFSSSYTLGLATHLHSLTDAKVFTIFEAQLLRNHIQSLLTMALMRSTGGFRETLRLTANLLDAYFETYERAAERFNLCGTIEDHKRRGIFRELTQVREHAIRLKGEYLNLARKVNRSLGDRAVNDHLRDIAEIYQYPIASS